MMGHSHQKQPTLELRPLLMCDAANIANAFSLLGWNKPTSQYESYFDEAAYGVRTTIIARQADEFAGYVTVKWKSDYPPFRDAAIPEIQDFNVLPDFRRRGIGSRLMDEVETIIGTRSPVAGIGVALDPGYGGAQRMYVLRGYVPDGNGAASHSVQVKWGDIVTVDDELTMYLTKPLAAVSR